MITEQCRAMLADIDRLNSEDPNISLVDGEPIPNELLYGQRMSSVLGDFNAKAPELLQIAVRAQHLERWILARGNFPEGRSGYKKWRSQLALHHATRTAELMQKHAYAQTDIERVKYLLLKRGLKHDDDSQCLEDVACLVFLRDYFDDFAAKHTEEKLINIVRLTWGKMSAKAQQASLSLKLSSNAENLINKALASA